MTDEWRYESNASPEPSTSARLVHDLRNVLTVMSGCVSALQGRGIDRRHPDLIELDKALHDAGQITAELLDESRSRVVERQALDLNQVVSDLRPRLQHLAGPAVTLSLRLMNTPAVIAAEHSEIDRLLSNLVVNAREAIDDTGEITVEVGPIHLVESGRGRAGTTANRHIRVTVADTGSGIEPDIIGKVFDPFFTTKGDRTGLGLASVSSIVRSLGGWVLLESTPGVGTRMHVCLPALENR